MTTSRWGSRLLMVFVIGVLSAGLWQIWEESWIYVKAEVAQHLLQRAWSRTRAGDRSSKPWPWADTWPVARLTLCRRDTST